jgi:hypothetical protein
MALWTLHDLQIGLHRFFQAICFLLEPPEVAVDTLKFEPVRSASVKVAIEAGWIQGLADGRSHTSSELVRPGQSEELLGIQSRPKMTSTLPRDQADNKCHNQCESSES